MRVFLILKRIGSVFINIVLIRTFITIVIVYFGNSIFGLAYSVFMTKFGDRKVFLKVGR